MEEEHDQHMNFKEDAWRVFRIISEFVDGFENLTNLGPSVSIFGSARIPEGNPYYDLCMEVSKEIASRGFAIITGGGPGIMEAANLGCRMASGKSCGVAVDLPHEKEFNPFIDPEYRLKFRYFFIRKVMFIRYAQGFVFLPGGYGTLDELFEALTLIQTKKIRKFPIYLIGKSYWRELFDWMEGTMLAHGYITKEDLQLLQRTDDPMEVANGIERHYQRNRSLKNF